MSTPVNENNQLATLSRITVDCISIRSGTAGFAQATLSISVEGPLTPTADVNTVSFIDRPEAPFTYSLRYAHELDAPSVSGYQQTIRPTRALPLGSTQLDFHLLIQSGDPGGQELDIYFPLRAGEIRGLHATGSQTVIVAPH